MITVVTVNTPKGEFELKFNHVLSYDHVIQGVYTLYPNWTSLVVVVLRIFP